MFTSCPACQRQYRISAKQLAAAEGIARCGYCGKEFNALQRLTDKPVKLSVKTPPRDYYVAEVENDDEPQFDIPEILASEERPETGTATRVFRVFLVILLLLVIFAQLSWFNRDYLLQRYPQLQPWAERLCEKLDCKVVRQSGTAGIKLLNRDVRLHPNYRDTLLVNATMANRSDKVVPFPRIQFALFDTEGKIIAERKFNPPEYLDGSINIKQGMLINQPVHFVLEVTGPTQDAVSFEFRFL
ncbi:MAG TPA: zinc-ribbon and DUF3426 domain-containing protein [Gammaproteobacteria bacterium]|nr:zinc-ribbon and DUF3426 domain-containing protein [Gammaproteobacteria bacterium]